MFSFNRKIHPYYSFGDLFQRNRFVYAEAEGAKSDIPASFPEKSKEPLQSLDKKTTETMCVALAEETKAEGEQKIDACFGNDDRLMQDRPDQEMAEAMDIISKDEIDTIRDALLPDTYVNKGVKWVNNQQKLEGYQRILLAPANAFEGVARGIIGAPEAITSMFKAATEADKGTLDKAGKLVWEVFMNHMSMAEKSAIGIQLVGEALTGAGLLNYISKISKSAKVLNIVARIGNALPKFRKAGEVGAIGRITGKITEKGSQLVTKAKETNLGKLVTKVAENKVAQKAYKVGSEGKDLAKSAKEKGEQAQKTFVEKGKTGKKGGSDKGRA